MLSLLIFSLVACVVGLIGWNYYTTKNSNEIIKQHRDAVEFYREKAATSEAMADQFGKEARKWKQVAANTSANVIETQRVSEQNPVVLKVGAVVTQDDIGTVSALSAANYAKIQHIKVIENVVATQDKQISALELAVRNMKLERQHLEGIIDEQKGLEKKAKVTWGSGGLVVGILIGILL